MHTMSYFDLVGLQLVSYNIMFFRKELLKLSYNIKSSINRQEVGYTISVFIIN